MGEYMFFGLSQPAIVRLGCFDGSWSAFRRGARTNHAISIDDCTTDKEIYLSSCIMYHFIVRPITGREREASNRSVGDRAV